MAGRAKITKVWSGVAAAACMLAVIAGPSCVIRLHWPEHEVTLTHVTSASVHPMITRARVVYDALDLIACEDDEIAARTPWWASLAHAHTPDTPTHLGRTRVIELLGEGTTELGVMRPDAGRYCAVSVLIKAADGDVEGDEQGQMHDKSVWIEPREGASIRGTLAAQMTLPLVPAMTLDDEESQRYEVTIAHGLEGVPDAHDARSWLVHITTSGARARVVRLP